MTKRPSSKEASGSSERPISRNRDSERVSDMLDMHAVTNRLFRLTSPLAATFAGFSRLARRWMTLLGQLPAPSHNLEIDAYATLAQHRRRRTCQGRRIGIVLSLPGCIDDAQLNLRITM